MDWNFGEVLWTMLVFFFWIIFIWMFIAIFADIFRRDDLSGWGKAGWIVLVVVLPFIGILIYMIARPKMTEQDRRMLTELQERERRMAGYSAADLRSLLLELDFNAFKDEAWEDRIPVAGVPLSIVKDRGIFEGEFFLNWIREQQERPTDADRHREKWFEDAPRRDPKHVLT